ncbi:MAG: thiamine-monophosphate kinase [Pseudomonadota bacterium]|jgi:thiamine-monophosphate kinase
MALTETDIIARYFQQPGLAADPALQRNIALGIGDDCALITVPRGKQLALSMDVLAEGVHFPAGADPAQIAWRALAVNLSDLAAMGAEPLCFTLGLTLPTADEAWLDAFSSGLRACAQQYDCPLVGGNLTRGPLQIAIQVQGLVRSGEALLRSAAKPGQDVYVSGTTGRAGLALDYLQGRCDAVNDAQRADLLAAYYRPEPRLALGQALCGIARAAQDVSDGLLADLAHIARSSKVQITVDIAAIPLAGVLTALRDSTDVFRLALTAGDDYELVFTAPASKKKAVAAAAKKAGVQVTRIGKVAKGEGVQVQDLSGRTLTFTGAGYEHFGAGG